MLTCRAANPAVSAVRARRNPTVRDFRDRIRPGFGLLTHRPYPMSRCRCGECPAKSRQSVRPWQVAGLRVDVSERRLLRLPREGVPACFGRSACSADGVRGCPRDPPPGCQRPRTYGGQRRRGECHSDAFAQVRGYVMGRGAAVCKTVGSAYVGSNPTPATRFRRSEPVTLDCVTGFCVQGERFSRPSAVVCGPCLGQIQPSAAAARGAT
jgi:hypothetical protein